jgi:hypothetical protein
MGDVVGDTVSNHITDTVRNHSTNCITGETVSGGDAVCGFGFVLQERCAKKKAAKGAASI